MCFAENATVHVDPETGRVWAESPKPRQLPTDPTPTAMRWKVELFAGEWGAIGIEWPIALEHAERLAGKMILDCGVWRELRHVYVPLPSDPDKAEVMKKLRESAL